MGRTFVDAGAQSISAGAITSAQTTLTLTSTANFGGPTTILPISIVILDSGNPAYSAANPLATPFEYQLVTNNNTGTNVLTINSGVRSSYAGTTPKAFFAGATVAVVLLAEDLNLLPQRFATQAPSSGTAITQTIPSLFRHVEVIYDIAINTINTSVFMQVNGDVGAHYYWTSIDSTPSSTPVTNGAQASTSAQVGFVGTGGLQAMAGRIRLNDIQQAARSIRWEWWSCYDHVGFFHDYRGSGLWLPSALTALTSIVIFIGGGAITSSNFDFVGYP